MQTLIAAPANNERGPRYMEKALAAIHQARLRQGPMTLAYGCVDSQVALMLQCGAGDREAVLGPISAGYPQCSLVAVEDPVVPAAWTTWCVDVQLEPELYQRRPPQALPLCGLVWVA